MKDSPNTTPETLPPWHLEEDDIKNKIIKFTKLLKNLTALLEIDLSTVKVNAPLLAHIFERISESLYRYQLFNEPMNPSEAKDIALYAYWIAKDKPIQLSINTASSLYEERGCGLNELFAIQIIIDFVNGLKKDLAFREKAFSTKKIDSLIFHFTRKDANKESIILYVEGLLADVLP